MTWTDNYKRYNLAKEGYGNAGQWKRSFYTRMSPDETSAILNEEDPWIVLGIPNGSPIERIKKAFRKMALKWHPDKNPGNIPKAEAMMKKINAAYSILI